MSGTSLDGVDAAELVTDGQSVEAFGPTAFRAYGDGERAALRGALGRWPDEDGVAAAARVVEDAHAAVLADFPDARLVGFHGQTLAHDPARGRTHQAGDAGRLSDLLSRAVAHDFRAADVAAGGEGAPLAPVYHHALAQRIGGEAVAFLNLGGVGNLTWADPGAADPGDGLAAFDTGPANAPIDDLCAALGRRYDAEGMLARSGTADGALVAAFMADPYFARPAPKSLDRDAFRAAGAGIDALPPADAAATWVAVIAATVAAGLPLCPTPPTQVVVCGGGRRNPAIMDALREALPVEVVPAEAQGFDGDMIEAQAFAFMAVRVLRGLPISFPRTTGVARPMAGGRIAGLDRWPVGA